MHTGRVPWRDGAGSPLPWQRRVGRPLRLGGALGLRLPAAGLLLLGALLGAGRRPKAVGGEALSLWGRRLRRPVSSDGPRTGSPSDGEDEGRAEDAKDVEPAPLHVNFIELHLQSPSWRVMKLLLPLSPEVAVWMTEEITGVTTALDPSLTRHPRAHVLISGRTPLEVGNVTASGVHAVVGLPEGAELEKCRVHAVHVSVDVEPLAGLGPICALLVLCPAKASAGSTAAAAWNALGGKHPLRWLLIPWLLFLLLLLPFIVGTRMGYVAQFGGACLTLALITCLSFAVVVLMLVAQRRCVHFTRRWRRLWRLRTLTRRPWPISGAFGDAGPCCICLAENGDQREKLIALLPCRHAMHAECYRSWVRADAYPSHDLICPMCRRRAEAIGKLGP